MDDGKQLGECRGHAGPVIALYETNDNKIVSWAKDGSISIWSMDGKT